MTQKGAGWWGGQFKCSVLPSGVHPLPALTGFTFRHSQTVKFGGLSPKVESRKWPTYFTPMVSQPSTLPHKDTKSTPPPKQCTPAPTRRRCGFPRPTQQGMSLGCTVHPGRGVAVRMEGTMPPTHSY